MAMKDTAFKVDKGQMEELLGALNTCVVIAREKAGSMEQYLNYFTNEENISGESMKDVMASANTIRSTIADIENTADAVEKVMKKMAEQFDCALKVVADSAADAAEGLTKAAANMAD